MMSEDGCNPSAIISLKISTTLSSLLNLKFLLVCQLIYISFCNLSGIENKTPPGKCEITVRYNEGASSLDKDAA